MVNSKKLIYVFVQKHCTTELEDIEPLNTHNRREYLTIEGDKIEKAYNAELCNGHYHFKKGLSSPEIGAFVQQLRDSIDTKLFFALRRGGKIWGVDRSGDYDLIETPYGDFRPEVKPVTTFS
jgi:hypothetical protein